MIYHLRSFIKLYLLFVCFAFSYEVELICKLMFGPYRKINCLSYKVFMHIIDQPNQPNYSYLTAILHKKGLIMMKQTD